MAVYNWECKVCHTKSRKILPARPKLGACSCGGQLEFVNEMTTRVVEVRDNGWMPKKVEQLVGVKEMIASRSTDPKKDDII